MADGPLIEHGRSAWPLVSDGVTSDDDRPEASAEFSEPDCAGAQVLP
jgi:hypothetical protein